MLHKTKFLSFIFLSFTLSYGSQSFSEEIKTDSNVFMNTFLSKVETIDKKHLLNIYTGKQDSYQNYKKSLDGFYQDIAPTLEKKQPTNIFESTENQSIELIYSSRNAFVDNFVNMQAAIFNEKLIIGKEKILSIQKMMKALKLQHQAGSLNEDTFKQIRWAMNKDIKEHSFYFQNKYYLLDVNNEAELLQKKEIPIYHPLERWEIEVVKVQSILPKSVEDSKPQKTEAISPEDKHTDNKAISPPHAQSIDIANNIKQYEFLMPAQNDAGLASMPEYDNKAPPQELMQKTKNQECMLDAIKPYLDQNSGVEDYCYPDSSENQRFNR